MKDFKKCIVPCELLKIGDYIIHSKDDLSRIVDIRKNNKSTTKIFCERDGAYYSSIYANDFKFEILRKF